MLRTDLPLELLRRGMWLLSGPTTAFTAINAGLTPDQYRIWLTECLTGLLPPTPATATHKPATLTRSAKTTTTS